MSTCDPAPELLLSLMVILRIALAGFGTMPLDSISVGLSTMTRTVHSPPMLEGISHFTMELVQRVK
jgi:hypothetical protein